MGGSAPAPETPCPAQAGDCGRERSLPENGTAIPGHHSPTGKPIPEKGRKKSIIFLHCKKDTSAVLISKQCEKGGGFRRRSRYSQFLDIHKSFIWNKKEVFYWLEAGWVGARLVPLKKFHFPV